LVFKPGPRDRHKSFLTKLWRKLFQKRVCFQRGFCRQLRARGFQRKPGQNLGQRAPNRLHNSLLRLVLFVVLVGACAGACGRTGLQFNPWWRTGC